MQSIAQEQYYVPDYTVIDSGGGGSSSSGYTTGYTTGYQLDENKIKTFEFFVKGSGKNIEVKFNKKFVKFPKSKTWDEFATNNLKQDDIIIFISEKTKKITKTLKIEILQDTELFVINKNENIIDIRNRYDRNDLQIGTEYFFNVNKSGIIINLDKIIGIGSKYKPIFSNFTGKIGQKKWDSVIKDYLIEGDIISLSDGIKYIAINYDIVNYSDFNYMLADTIIKPNKTKKSEVQHPFMYELPKFQNLSNTVPYHYYTGTEEPSSTSGSGNLPSVLNKRKTDKRGWYHEASKIHRKIRKSRKSPKSPKSPKSGSRKSPKSGSRKSGSRKSSSNSGLSKTQLMNPIRKSSNSTRLGKSPSRKSRSRKSPSRKSRSSKSNLGLSKTQLMIRKKSPSSFAKTISQFPGSNLGLSKTQLMIRKKSSERESAIRSLRERRSLREKRRLRSTKARENRKSFRQGVYGQLSSKSPSSKSSKSSKTRSADKKRAKDIARRSLKASISLKAKRRLRSTKARENRKSFRSGVYGQSFRRLPGF
jgi:hypothetical protein